jgi:predicted nucleic acid-binding Zn ribbon protein
MYCEQCGNKIEDSESHCSNCGKSKEKVKKNKFKKIIVFIGILFVSMFTISVVINDNKKTIHNAKIKQISQEQVDLYKNKLIPTLMGDFKDYELKNVTCKEIDPQGQCDYVIQIDSELSIGKDKKFNYPLIVLFNDNQDTPKYQNSEQATKDITDYIKQLNEEKEKNDKANHVAVVSAKDLYNAYDKNEVEANNEYSGKTGIITGKISSIDITNGTPSIKLIGSDSIAGVICYFDNNKQSDIISKLKKGQTARISGTIRGKGFMSVCIDNSSVL